MVDPKGMLDVTESRQKANAGVLVERGSSSKAPSAWQAK